MAKSVGLRSQMIPLLQEGRTSGEVAKILNCSVPSVSDCRKDLGFPKSKNICKSTTETVKWSDLQVVYDSEDMNIKDFCTKYSISDNALYRARKKGLFTTRSHTHPWSLKRMGTCKDPERKIQLNKEASIRAKNQGLGKYPPRGGNTKKYHVPDSFGKTVHLQSSFEKKCADILNELSVKWVRPDCLRYGKKLYFPDFYLVDFGIYLDPKNDYLAIKDQDKINSVVKENNVVVFILREFQLTTEYIQQLCKAS